MRYQKRKIVILLVVFSRTGLGPKKGFVVFPAFFEFGAFNLREAVADSQHVLSIFQAKLFVWVLVSGSRVASKCISEALSECFASFWRYLTSLECRDVP